MSDQKSSKYSLSENYIELSPGIVNISAFSIPNWVLSPSDEKNNIYILPTPDQLKSTYPINSYPSINMMPQWKIFCINHGSVPAIIKGPGSEGKVMIVANNTYTPGGSFLLYWNADRSTSYCLVSCPHDSDMSLSLRLSAMQLEINQLKEQLSNLTLKHTKKVIKQQETPDISDNDDADIPLDFAMVDDKF